MRSKNEELRIETEELCIQNDSMNVCSGDLGGPARMAGVAKFSRVIEVAGRAVRFDAVFMLF